MFCYHLFKGEFTEFDFHPIAQVRKLESIAEIAIKTIYPSILNQYNQFKIIMNCLIFIGKNQK